jgi:hypothetical protein
VVILSATIGAGSCRGIGERDGLAAIDAEDDVAAGEPQPKICA